MKEKFDTDFEYDSWVDRKQQEKVLEGYFGEEIKFERAEKDDNNSW